MPSGEDLEGNKSSPHDNLLLPALRAHMGDWVYYVSFMNMGDVAKRISVVEEIYHSVSLREMIQRKLTDRAGQIKDYLV